MGGPLHQRVLARTEAVEALEVLATQRDGSGTGIQGPVDLDVLAGELGGESP